MLFASACLALVLASPAKPDRLPLRPMPPGSVTITDGMFRRQMDEVKEYYLRIPNDDLLKGFRQRAGRPAPGNDLGGWYTSDTFHVFGQILSGLARFYAVTGDARCLHKANALLGGWAACIAPNGYFYYSNHPNAPHYTYEKMVGGLVDMGQYCHSKRALACLSRITDYAIRHLSRKREYAFNAGEGDTEWYTLSENLYRAYLLTGGRKYKDFAAVWEYTEYWDVYATRGDIFGKRANGKSTHSYHAYSHVNALSGAGAAYIVKGDEHYLDTLRNAYSYLQKHECFVTGGYGPDESLLPTKDVVQRLGRTHNSFETPCGSWAAFKLSKYLMTATGDAKYGDWLERLAFNALAAVPPMSPDYHIMYYSDYNTTEASKRQTDFAFSCCTGTLPEAVSDIPNLAYFAAKDGLCVNLYLPSTAKWQGVTLTQSTHFPEADRAEFTVSAKQATKCALRFRVPAWLGAPMRAAVNGKTAPLKADKGHWATLARTWKSGDRVSIVLPMGFHVGGVGGSRGYPAALTYGPLAMAVRASDRYPLKAVNLESPGRDLVPSPGEPLTWHVAGDAQMLVRPFYAVPEGEPYLMYVDPAAADQLPSRAIATTGHWLHSSLWYCNEVGATISATFEGTGVRWLGYRYDDAGKVQVELDGRKREVVDQYGDGRELPFDWNVSGLNAGRHTLRLTLLPEKNPASKDHYMNAVGFKVIGRP